MAVNECRDSAESRDAVSRVFEWSAYGRPCMGERLSGDAALAVVVEERLLITLIDVLGHGAEANALAQEMTEYVNKHPVAEPMTMLRNLHARFKGSRGSVVGCAVLEADSGGVAFAGIGNPSFRVVGPSQSVTLPVSAGIIGSQMRTPKVHHARMQPRDVLLACSDGVSAGFSIADYPQILSHGVWAVAHSIVRRFGKDHDDATCLVVRMLES